MPSLVRCTFFSLGGVCAGAASENRYEHIHVRLFRAILGPLNFLKPVPHTRQCLQICCCLLLIFALSPIGITGGRPEPGRRASQKRGAPGMARPSPTGTYSRAFFGKPSVPVPAPKLECLQAGHPKGIGPQLPSLGFPANREHHRQNPPGIPRINQPVIPQPRSAKQRG